MKKLFSFLALSATMFIATGTGALADPPARVGRLSYIQGEVSFHDTTQNQWLPATLNYPVTTGNSFWTDSDARTELQVGLAEIRMDQKTEMDITRLDDASTQLYIPQGVVNVHLRTQPYSPFQVMTPLGTVSLTRAGSYHIDAGRPNGNTPQLPSVFTVLEGEAQIQGPGSSVSIVPGESAVLTGQPPVLALEEGNPTSFDDWALARERREMELQSARYVSPEATGISDLDTYGQWSSVPNYGAVWYPTAVSSQWAPYRYGHWAYINPWGWTWVDDAPWGFAPFHYGRWAHIDGRWGWCPGEMAEHPVYAPALVAFVGGEGWSISVVAGSVPAVGWVPLAPHEVFHPYYPASVNYVKNVNITNVNKTVINNITVNNITNNVTINKFANQQAVTVVSSSAFAKGVPVHHSLLKVPNEQIVRAPVVAKLSHIQPVAPVKSGNTGLEEPKKPVSVPQTMQNAQPRLQPFHAEKENVREEQPHSKSPTVSVPPVYHPVAPAFQPQRLNVPHPMEGNHEGASARPQEKPVQHPAQQTHIQPTPQGWVRVPAERKAEDGHDKHPLPREEQHPHAEGKN